MDQEKFCDLDNVDAMDSSEIDLTEAPTSGEAYLRQVIVGRSKCQAIVVTDRDFTRYSSKQTPQIPSELLRESLPRASYSNLLFPPMAWRQKQVSEFDHLRTRLSQKRGEILKKSSDSRIKFPPVGNEAGWKKFCFETCSPQVAEAMKDCEKNNDLLKSHNGTPPLLTIVASLTHAQAMDLLEFQVAWFIDEGHSESRMHWLYALILLVEKPLTPETCSSLRDLARAFARLRRTLATDDEPEHKDAVLKACNLFLCLIVDYFGQKDLADW